jgi:tetratricopeptide (TPR) repeat protein
LKAVTAALSLLLAVAPCAAQDDEPSHPYRELLRRYASGERAAAVAAVAEWSPAELAGELKGLRRPGTYPDAEAARLRAAVMLHTDREALERKGVRGEESCEVHPQAAFAESLLGLLLAKDQAGAFGRRWYLAMALRSHGRLCLRDARRWADAGLKWAPRDARLLLARGSADEAIELFWTAPAVREWTGGAHLKEKLSDASARRATLRRAEELLAEALEISPDLHEARLRLGRVRWRQGRADDARATLEALLVQATGAHLRYLGHLFLGRVHEDQGRVEDAEVQYRAALHVDPASQVAAVALSYVLALAGDARSGRQGLADAVARAPRRHGDAFWYYRLGQAAQEEGLLDDLRREVAP